MRYVVVNFDIWQKASWNEGILLLKLCDDFLWKYAPIRKPLFVSLSKIGDFL